MRGAFNIHLLCPWGCGGEIIADNRVKLRVSVMCNKCRTNNFYIADICTMKTYRSKLRDCHNYPHRLICPHCGKGRIDVDGTGDVRISVICPKCKSAYIADCKKLKTYPSQKIRRAGRK